MEKMVGIILSCIFIVFIVALALGFIELAVPVVLKADFNRTCDVYAKKSIESGGLTTEQIDELAQEIENISDRITINSTSISKVGEIPYGGELIFEVDAIFRQSTMVTTMSRELKEYPFIYYKKFKNNFLVE